MSWDIKFKIGTMWFDSISVTDNKHEKVSSCGKIMYKHKLDLRVQWREKIVVNNA